MAKIDQLIRISLGIGYLGLADHILPAMEQNISHHQSIWQRQLHCERSEHHVSRR